MAKNTTVISMVVPVDFAAHINDFVAAQESDESRNDVLMAIVANATKYDLESYFEAKIRAANERKARSEAAKAEREEAASIKREVSDMLKNMSPAEMRKLLAANRK